MFNSEYLDHVIHTVITVVLFILINFLVKRVTRRYATTTGLSEHRTNLINKYIDIIMIIIFCIILLTVWGVKRDNIYVVVSSTFAVIGVAFFAQWSILSNITSGIILFFTFPFRLGDIIKIHDKDFPVEAQIEDIKAFHTLLRTKTGELLTYPNSLLLQKAVSIVSPDYEEKEFYD